MFLQKSSHGHLHTTVITLVGNNIDMSKDASGGWRDEREHAGLGRATGYDDEDVLGYPQTDTGQGERMGDELAFQKAYQDRVDAEEEMESQLFQLQHDIEREHHENDTTFVYGILDQEIFPALVVEDNQAYASEEWYQHKSENMLSLEAMVKGSNQEESILSSLGMGMDSEMPPELKEQAEELVPDEDIMQQVDEEISRELEGMYLFPVTSSEDYWSTF